ncbi:MAG TPA: hypothetical protein VMR62_37340 [Bryobacteraceae bacterium]|nr:hypothetical protein [Bryobacteraceae bacterium]
MALALLAISVAMAPAKDGRDFAGFYSLTGASPDGDQVHVTLTVQLYNYSGADLEQAAVAIRSGPPETITFGTYDAVHGRSASAPAKPSSKKPGGVSCNFVCPLACVGTTNTSNSSQTSMSNRHFG